VSIKTYSVDEVADGLDCTPRWLTEQVRAGKFPARKVARHWRFTEEDVAAIFALCANNFRGLADADTTPGSTTVRIVTGLTPRSRRRLVGP
jgi:excisionase family DNA binding protein